MSRAKGFHHYREGKKPCSAILVIQRVTQEEERGEESSEKGDDAYVVCDEENALNVIWRVRAFLKNALFKSLGD
ncbi:hypothetical protein MNL09_07385 [Bartonella krasnovii]|nr:hypothetical protein MNL09_07385 [Bartonella krasnovii]